MSTDDKWVVKLTRTGHESVVSIANTKEAAQQAADDFNSTYQTDEYYVEEWDDEKWGKW